MSNIRLDLDSPIIDGQTLTFKSPADCSSVTGLILYYPYGDTTSSKVFQFADAHGNNIGDLDLFSADSLVKVVVDTKSSLAFVQNADTNAYLEARLDGKEDRHGSVVVTIPADKWVENSQTITVKGVTSSEDCDIIISPDPSCHDLYCEAGVYCSEQGEGTLTFKCKDVPEEPLTVNIILMSKGGSGGSSGGGSYVGSVTWDSIEDKPFSKETDPAVYVVSAFEQLPYVKGGAEEYSYGTFLFEAEKIPGSAEAFFSIDGSTRTVPISELNGYQQGRFSIWGSTFCIYCEMNRFGRYDIYALAKSNSAYGAELHFKNFAYIDHLPTEYINVSELKNILGLPATWASLPDKPFNVVEQPVNYPIQSFTANTVYLAETYPYISALITTVSRVPSSVDITAFGNSSVTVRESNDFGFISDTFSSGPVQESAVRFEPNNSGGWDVYVLSKSAWTDSWGGYVSSFSYVTPLNFKVLPMDDIIVAVKKALGL